MELLASLGVLLGGLSWLFAQTFGENTTWRRLATLGALAAVGVRIAASATYADQSGHPQLTFLFPVVFALGAFSLGAAVSASGLWGEMRLPSWVTAVLDPGSRLPPTTNRLWLVGEVVSAAAVILVFGWARPVASFVWGSPATPGTDPWPGVAVVAVAALLALLAPRWSRPGVRGSQTSSDPVDVRWVVRRVASALRSRVAVVGAPVAWLVWQPLPDAAGTMIAVLLVAVLAVVGAWPTVGRVTRVSGQVAGREATLRVLEQFDEPWQAWETYHPEREDRDRQHKPKL